MVSKAAVNEMINLEESRNLVHRGSDRPTHRLVAYTVPFNVNGQLVTGPQSETIAHFKTW